MLVGNMEGVLMSYHQQPRLGPLQRASGCGGCSFHQGLIHRGGGARSTMLFRPPRVSALLSMSSSPSSPNSISGKNLWSLSPSDGYLFLHQPSNKNTDHLVVVEEAEDDDDMDVEVEVEVEERLYGLSEMMKEKVVGRGKRVIEMVDIKNQNRLQVDLSNSRCIGASRGWLLYVNRTTLALHLLYPFLPNPPIIPLPPIESLPTVLRSVLSRSPPCNKYTSDDNNHVHPSSCLGAGGGAYSSGGCVDSSAEFLITDELEPISSKEFLCYDRGGGITSFVLSSDPLDNYNDCTVMIVCNRRLAFCRLSGDRAWTALKVVCSEMVLSWTECHQLLYSDKHKLFYALYGGHRIEVWDLNTNPTSPKLVFYSDIDRDELPTDRDPKDYRVNVGGLAVDSLSGELLMPLQYYYSASGGGGGGGGGDGRGPKTKRRMLGGFDIFKLDLSQEKWRPSLVEDLGDRALLLDHNQSTFVSPSRFPVFKPNSIYCSLYVYESGPVISEFDVGNRSINAFLFPSTRTRIYQNGASWVIPPAAALHWGST